MATEHSQTATSSLAVSEVPPSHGQGVRASEQARSSAELDRLMDRYAAGDTSAFRELHRQIAPRLRMFLLHLCGSPRLADDLLQDTFLRIHRARGSFTVGAAVLPWTYAITRNVYIDHARKGRDRNSESIDHLPDGTQPAAPNHTSPDAELVGRETLDVVRTTLAKLPVTHREAFILIRFDGLSVAEAAQVLDTSEANVKVRAFRAYEAFRVALNLKEGNKP